MPSIKFDERTLSKTRKKEGVYKQLDKPVIIRTQPQIDAVHQKVTDAVTLIVRQAFLEYAKAHGCKPENLDVEWNRFRRILKKYL